MVKRDGIRKISPCDEGWRAQGVSVTTLVSVDVRESHLKPVWEADPTSASTNKRAGRVVIDSPATLGTDGPIYIHGKSLSQIAAWLEQAAATVRAFEAQPEIKQ